MNILKTMVGLQSIEAEEARTRIEMKGAKEEVSKCKEAVEKILQWINVIKSKFNDWREKKSYLKN